MAYLVSRRRTQRLRRILTAILDLKRWSDLVKRTNGFSDKISVSFLEPTSQASHRRNERDWNPALPRAPIFSQFGIAIRPRCLHFLVFRVGA